MKHYKEMPPKEIIEKLYVTDRKTMAKVARRVGLSKTTIYKLLKEYGIKARTKKEYASRMK